MYKSTTFAVCHNDQYMLRIRVLQGSIAIFLQARELHFILESVVCTAFFILAWTVEVPMQWTVQ